MLSFLVYSRPIFEWMPIDNDSGQAYACPLNSAPPCGWECRKGGLSGSETLGRMPSWNLLKLPQDTIRQCLKRREVSELSQQLEATVVWQPDRAFTLAQYLDLIADIPQPTAEQRAAFAEFVSQAHSWYKHLARALPGRPFYVFLDKYAGCDRVETLSGGSAALVERAVCGLHYSDLPTLEYRKWGI